MKRVFTSESVPMAWHVKNVLEFHNIDAVVKNEGLLSIAGEVPISECQPEVWVLNDLYYPLAEKLVLELESEPEISGDDWICTSCQESNIASYGICWNCQSSVDGEEEK
ncbi:MAG: DUF2007 domain-containing protein [Pseudohongiellaceae bacterium]